MEKKEQTNKEEKKKHGKATAPDVIMIFAAIFLLVAAITAMIETSRPIGTKTVDCYTGRNYIKIVGLECEKNTYDTTASTALLKISGCFFMFGIFLLLIKACVAEVIDKRFKAQVVRIK